MVRDGQPVTIAATPAPLVLDIARSAVLVVDMQNDFGAEGGMFHRAGIDITPIQAAVAPTARVLAAARAAGITVIYLTMEFRPDLSDAGAPDSPNFLRHRHLGVGEEMTAPDESAGRVLIRGTWNTEILPALAPEAGDIVVSKQRFSGFYETDLDTILKSLEVRYLIVVGCTTSVCVESTIRDAMFRDYSCLLLADCTAEPLGNTFSRSNHDASLLTIQTLLGWVSTSDKLLTGLRVAGAGA